MHRGRWVEAGVCGLGVALAISACGGDSSTGFGGTGGSGTGGSNTGGSGVGGGGTSSGGASGSGGAAGSSGVGASGGASGAGGAVDGGGGTSACSAGPNEDKDKDGFAIAAGDCNDCDANVNPNAVEVVATGASVDDDCDGKVDNLPALCDDTLDVAAADPTAAAKAIDICKTSSGAKDWGLVSAKWVQADGAAPPTPDTNFHLGHGILSAFGTNVKVQQGKRMLGLSSGSARQPTDPGYQDPSGFAKGYQGSHPTGFPKEAPACPNVTTGTPHDATGVELVIRVPSNAVGFSYDSKFYTYEWPGYICSQYNDFFVAILSPVPSGQTDGNVAFDPKGNPMSVNNTLLDVCGCATPPCTAGGKTFACTLGTKDLEGTGFTGSAGEQHGATGWLTTSVPAAPGSEITIRLATYDSGDGVLDSTELLDNWRWIVGTAPAKPTTAVKQ